jgi:CO/xanthine dehydrogenase Mo-binding subunit
MNAEPYTINLDHDLARRLREAGQQPVILEDEDGGIRYRVLRETDHVNFTDEPWAHYDAEKMRRAVHAAAGILVGVDRDELLADLRAQRGQDSHGRPADE